MTGNRRTRARGAPRLAQLPALYTRTLYTGAPTTRGMRMPIFIDEDVLGDHACLPLPYWLPFYAWRASVCAAKPVTMPYSATTFY